jgi:hypothetical protein
MVKKTFYCCSSSHSHYKIFNDKERGHHDRDPLHLTAIIRSSMIRRGAIMAVILFISQPL